MKTLTALTDVHLLYLRLLEAWNERSPDDYAALFAEDSTAIGSTEARSAALISPAI